MCTSPLFRHPHDCYQSGRSKIYGFVEYENISVSDPLYAAELQRIPCGQCLECRLKKAKEWCYRILIESKQYPEDECWFLTLTYDEYSLDSSYIRDYLDTTTGVVRARYALHPKDHQDFMKRLRVSAARLGLEKKLRFFACGEYGGSTERPHFHCIIFGLPFKLPSLLQSDVPELDLKLYKKRVDHPLYNNDWLSKVWGKGFVTISPLTAETAAYCARYCLKTKLGLQYQEECEAQDLIDGGPFPREFVVMSRKPGIARDYFDQHKDEIYFCDQIPLSVRDKLEVIKPFRYYDKLFDHEDEFEMCSIKAHRRRSAEAAQKQKLRLTDKAERDQLRDRAERLKKRTKKLYRNEI